MEVPSSEEQKVQESGMGAVAGIVIIVALLIAGGIYFFLSETSESDPLTPNAEEQES